MARTLDKLFGSRTRVKLLTLLLANPERTYYVREITRRLDERINSIRRELANLEKIGLVTSQTTRRKRFYTVNTRCAIYPELRALILKVGVAPEERVIKQVGDLGSVKLAVLTGVFTKYDNAQTDLLLVGSIDKKKLKTFVTSLENEIQDEIDYTMLSLDEYEYRWQMTDRFVMNIYDHDYMIILDKINMEERINTEKQKIEQERIKRLQQRAQLSE